MEKKDWKEFDNTKNLKERFPSELLFALVSVIYFIKFSYTGNMLDAIIMGTSTTFFLLLILKWIRDVPE